MGTGERRRDTVRERDFLFFGGTEGNRPERQEGTPGPRRRETHQGLSKENCRDTNRRLHDVLRSPRGTPRILDEESVGILQPPVPIHRLAGIVNRKTSQQKKTKTKN